MELCPDKIDSIRAEAQDLNLTIQKLSEKRLGLLRLLNAIDSRPKELPPETLSIILYHACPPADPFRTENDPRLGNQRSYNILNCSHVCNHWRNVAFSMPHMWTTMTIVVHGYTDIQRSADILALHFQNVGNLPFSLCFHQPLTVTEMAVDPIAQVLFQRENAGKVGSLSLHDWYPREWLIRLSHNFSHLKNLTCFDGAPRNSFPDLNPSLPPNVGVPNLTSISLTQCFINFNTSWEGITKLKLASMSVSACADLLFRCPNLVVFRAFHVLRPGQHDPGPNITTIQTFPHLIDFAWAHGFGVWYDSIISHIRLPALQKFLLCSDVGISGNDHLLRLLVEVLYSASATLVEVEFSGSTLWFEPSWKQLFAPLKAVRTLTFNNGDSRTAATLVAALTPGANSNTNLLPNLTMLRIEECVKEVELGTFEVDMMRWLSPAVAQMLGARGEPGTKSEFSLSIFMEWVPEAWWRVSEMIRNGAMLNVLTYEELMDSVAQ